MAIAVGWRHQLNVWARWHGRRHAGTIPDYLNLADVRRMFVFWMGFSNAKEYPGARARVCSHAFKRPRRLAGSATRIGDTIFAFSD